MKNHSIGYFLCREKDSSFSGGVLVTDHRGIPVDFKYTDPIIPNRYQKNLFGKILEPYLRKQVIGKNLIDRLESKPALILVSQDSLSDMQEEFNFPVLYIEESSKKLDAKEDLHTDGDGGIFIKNHFLNASYSVVSTGEFIKRGADELVFFARHMELLEPFERLKITLDDLAKDYAENLKKEASAKKSE